MFNKKFQWFFEGKKMNFNSIIRSFYENISIEYYLQLLQNSYIASLFFYLQPIHIIDVTHFYCINEAIIFMNILEM